MINRSPANSTLEYLLTFINVRAAYALKFIQDTQLVFIYRPGTVNPTPPIYNDFPTLYAAFIASGVIPSRPKVIQIDDTIISPAVIPAGLYTDVTTLFGNFNTSNGNLVQVSLADGVQFPDLNDIADNIVLTSFSTSVPVIDITTNGKTLIIERGAEIDNAVGSTVPFIHVAAPNSLTLVLLDGGRVGSTTGVPCISIDAGANVTIILDIFASLANNVIVGLGTAQAILSSQTSLINTPFPIVQTGLTSFSSLIFDFANNISFANLNAGNWVAPPPTNVEEAINRMAALLVVLNAGPIP